MSEFDIFLKENLLLLCLEINIFIEKHDLWNLKREDFFWSHYEPCESILEVERRIILLFIWSQV